MFYALMQSADPAAPMLSIVVADIRSSGVIFHGGMHSSGSSFVGLTDGVIIRRRVDVMAVRSVGPAIHIPVPQHIAAVLPLGDTSGFECTETG